MDLSIIIVSFNTKDLLKNCLTSVFNTTKGINFEVFVVDNGSTDGSIEMVKKKFPKVFLIKNKKNLGFARANNQALKKAKGEYLLLLNSDTKILDNALEKLVNFAKGKEELGIVGPKLLNPDKSPQPSAAPFYTLPVVFISLLRGDSFLRRSYQETREVDWVAGACFLIKKEITKKIGFLDEEFFMYIEEMEFCFRAKKAGYKTYFYPAAKIFHLVRGSSTAGKREAIWWIYKGLIYFYQKHFAPWQLRVLKFLLQAKALGAWFAGILSGSDYLKKTYAKAFELAR